MLSKITVLAIALAAPALPQAQDGPYAGQHTREIKALSAAERASLLQGQGMGYAKAAELNGYPGPAHVLELAGELQLSTAQQEATSALLAGHRAAARALGAAVVAAERDLDEAFALRRADAGLVQRLTAEIARLQGELRAEHLKAHLAQTALLQPHQVARYAQLRGYAGPAGAGGGHRH